MTNYETDRGSALAAIQSEELRIDFHKCARLLREDCVPVPPSLSLPRRHGICRTTSDQTTCNVEHATWNMQFATWNVATFAIAAANPDNG